MQARIAELQEQLVMLQSRLAHYEGGGAALPALTAPADESAV